jgi:glycosyltransferase involved in cell wall biosynthesis
MPRETVAAHGAQRVLHLIPTLEGGGAERQLLLLASEQVARGRVVRIGLRRRGIFADAAERAGVGIVELGDGRPLHPTLLRVIHRVVREFRPDLVHTWLTQADVCGGLVARFAGVPWVMTERNSGAAYGALSAASLLRRALAPSAQALIANSLAGARYWRGARRAPVDVVRNAVDAAAVGAAVARGRVSRQAGAKPLVLSVGRLVPSKGHAVVLDAWARARPEAELRILGRGPMRSRLEALAARCANAGVEDFRDDWWELLGRAAAFVLMSEFEGAPNAVMEAAAAGVPLVLSDIPAHRELLDDDGAWFVPVGDGAAAARALVACLSDPAVAAARAAAAAQRVASMTIRASADATDAVYARVAVCRRAAGPAP